MVIVPGKTRFHRHPLVLLTSVLLAAVSACAGPVGQGPDSKPSASNAGTGTALRPPTIAGVKWAPAGRLVHGISAVYVASLNGTAVKLMWMNPQLLRFRFIPGYQYPEGGPSQGIDHQPATWVHAMVAAFNGAFKLRDNAGGYFYNGRIVRTLRPGLASLTIDKSGKLKVGVWQQGSRPPAGTDVVRQNLTPLILDGRSMAHLNDSPARWGRTDGGLSHANRTALGELADGSLVFANADETTAQVISGALVRAHVRTAMMLDMNKSWPTGFVYEAPIGGHMPIGRKIQQRTWRAPSTYFKQFEKDFVVAVAR